MTKETEHFGRIGVLMGGVSSERAISLKSGQAIAQALERQGYQVVALDIDRGTPDKIAEMILRTKIDSAFIALHGRLGEDGTIQQILEQAHIPYTGSGVDSSRKAMNKAIAQKIFKENNIRVPTYVSVAKGETVTIEDVLIALGSYPIVVKPANEGSSIGISIVHSRKTFETALDRAWQYDNVLMLEQYIEGREMTVGILNQTALPVVEICPTKKFFDYEAKYIKGLTDYIVPARISESLAREIQDIALRAHNVLGCSDLSRVDFMLDKSNLPYVLEINTIPGFTSTSLLPKAAAVKGINFDQLCVHLMELAYGKKKEISGNNSPVC